MRPPSGLRACLGRATPWLASAFMLAGNGVAAQTAASGSGTASASASAADAALEAQWVKTGLYLITGGGGNSLLRLSAVGSILVDGKQAGQHRALMSQVRRISRLSDLPIRVLVVTDHHAHHTADLAPFRAAGVAVLAQENARQRLPIAAETPASGSKVPGPVIGFERDYKLRIGGVAVDLFHFGSGHTDNDTVVLFPDLKVVAVGDLFTTGTPLPDVASGGSLAGWSSVLEQVLKLDFELVVPGNGPIVGRAELMSLKSRIDELIARSR